MSTLHFNTEAGRQMAAALATARGNVETELNSLNGRIGSFVGAEWQGQAAMQFQMEFETWANNLRTQLQTLSDLQNRLNAEIAAWEQVGSSFSGG